ncbi:MAG TPA: response regulator transcription factor [Burkholderiaceae bacterium]|nr:response regulator transcription factor [Burkholderiaceae bacterium]
MGVRVLIIDDHPLVLDAVRMTLTSIEPDSHVDAAFSFADARRLLASDTNWDFALLDLSLPDIDGFDGLAALRELRPDTPTIVLSAQTDRETILRCIDLGALGYIPKTYPTEVLQHALRLVASGHVYLPFEALGRDTPGMASSTPQTPAQAEDPGLRATGQPQRPTSHGFRDGPGARVHGPAAGRGSLPPDWQAEQALHGAQEPPPAPSPQQLGLTGRQADVLRLILRGLPNKLICRQLDLAEGTVKVHVSAVLRALGVRNRTQAVIAASRLGLNVNDLH